MDLEAQHLLLGDLHVKLRVLFDRPSAVAVAFGSAKAEADQLASLRLRALFHGEAGRERAMQQLLPLLSQLMLALEGAHRVFVSAATGGNHMIMPRERDAARQLFAELVDMLALVFAWSCNEAVATSTVLPTGGSFPSAPGVRSPDQTTS